MKKLLVIISCFVLFVRVNAQDSYSSTKTGAQIDTAVGGVFPYGLKSPDGDPDSCVFIDSDGNVGFGIDPTEEVHFYNNQDGAFSTRFDNPNTGTSAFTEFYLIASGSPALATRVYSSGSSLALNKAQGGLLLLKSMGQIRGSAAVNGVIVGTSSTDPLMFMTNNIIRTTITSGGFFGIGDSSALATLTITNTAPTFALFDNDLEHTHAAFANYDSATVTIDVNAGAGRINYYGSDADAYSQSINTSDQAIFTGASGGYVFDNPINFASDTSTSDAYDIVLPSIAALVTGLEVTFKAVTANTDGATLTVNALTAKALTKASAGAVNTALATGDILAGQIVKAVYDGTQFQVISRLAQ